MIFLRSQNGAIPRCGLPANGHLQPACEKCQLNNRTNSYNCRYNDGSEVPATRNSRGDFIGGTASF
jgi:hypothetical protein